MTYKIIPLILLLTAFAACATKSATGSFYSSRLNGLAISSQQSAADSAKASAQIEVNTREIAAVNAEIKKDAQTAERDSSALGRKR